MIADHFLALSGWVSFVRPLAVLGIVWLAWQRRSPTKADDR